MNFYIVENVGSEIIWSSSSLDYSNYIELGSRFGSYVLVPILHFGPDIRIIETSQGVALERGEFEATKRVLVRLNIKITESEFTMWCTTGVQCLAHGTEHKEVHKLLLLEDESSFSIPVPNGNGDSIIFFAKDGELKSILESEKDRNRVYEAFAEAYAKGEFSVI
jgi:hypothetical protein